MKQKTLLASAVCLAAGALAAPVASATCDISDTTCALDGSKCNIKFRNKTGDSGGSDGSSGLNQTSSAQTVLVKAIDESGNRLGNKLQIIAGASKTMNVEKKAKSHSGFNAIRLTSKDYSGAVDGATMSCEDIKAVLNGNGVCKVFHGVLSGTATHFSIGYQCYSGNVGGPKK